jgi:hypothetical protein
MFHFFYVERDGERIAKKGGKDLKVQKDRGKK